MYLDNNMSIFEEYGAFKNMHATVLNKFSKIFYE